MPNHFSAPCVSGHAFILPDVFRYANVSFHPCQVSAFTKADAVCTFADSTHGVNGVALLIKFNYKIFLFKLLYYYLLKLGRQRRPNAGTSWPKRRLHANVH
jgi:hypothetical protein